jgi:hypothetical protein
MAWPKGIELIPGPFSPASLLTLAAEQEERHRQLLEQFPPGTINDDRNAARELSEIALECARWMEMRGIAEMAHVGPFHTFLPKRGDRIRIKKGAIVFSTAPGVGREGVAVTRAQVVTVRDADRGYVSSDGFRGSGDDRFRQGQVRWAGVGGYWRWTDLNNVELIPQAETSAGEVQSS